MFPSRAAQRPCQVLREFLHREIPERLTSHPLAVFRGHKYSIANAGRKNGESLRVGQRPRTTRDRLTRIARGRFQPGSSLCHYQLIDGKFLQSVVYGQMKSLFQKVSPHRSKLFFGGSRRDLRRHRILLDGQPFGPGNPSELDSLRPVNQSDQRHIFPGNALRVGGSRSAAQ